MGLGCSEGYFWDGLVRKCLTCQMVCQQPHRHLRCIEYCGQKVMFGTNPTQHISEYHSPHFQELWWLRHVMDMLVIGKDWGVFQDKINLYGISQSSNWFDTFTSEVSLGCKAVPGQYYDRLLKKCLRCAAVCGNHPSECSNQCQTQQPALIAILRPVDGNAFQNHTTRGGYLPRGLPNSVILVYSLLGLCLALLLLTLSVALLVLLRRARAMGPRPGATQNSHTQGHRGQEGQEPNQHSQSSKDCLMDPSLPQLNSVTASRSSSPTETCVCVHCFPDLGVPGRGEKKQRPPLTLYQQAVPQDFHSPTRAPHCGSSQRIICSPCQPSF